MSRVEDAVNDFQEGINCSQAVLLSFAKQYGLDSESAFRIATGFGGGMRMGGTCGAVSGAIMVLGLEYGMRKKGDLDAKQLTYGKVLEFSERFGKRNKSVKCSDLIGYDMGTSEGREEAKRRNLFKTVCPKFIRDAVEILEDML